jgi:hypothetical protein
MNRITLKAFAATALLSIAGAVFAGSSDETLKQIDGYRQWTRINEKPIEVNNALTVGA